MKHKAPQRAFALLALSTLACGSAWAQSSPYYFGGVIGVTRNSNVFGYSDARASEELALGRIASKSDRITTTTLLAGIDQPFGRQRLNASASLRNNHFADNKDLTHMAYDANARLDWETVDRISGSLNARTAQSRQVDDTLDRQGTERVLSRSRDFGGTLRMGVVTRFTVEGSLGHRQQDFKRDSGPDDRDYKLTSSGLSLRYSANPDLTLGTGLRLGDGRYTTLNTDFKRRDIDLFATWRPSGASSLNARLSASKIDYKPVAQADFSGLTGDIGWDWQPTGKIRLASRLSRDNRDTAGQLDTSTDTSRISTRLSITADYELSAKIALTTTGSLSKRTLEDFNSLPGTTTQPGRDRVYALSFGARWTPLRVLTLSCDVSKTQRTVSQAGLTTGNLPLTAPYNINTLGCAAQVVLQ